MGGYVLVEKPLKLTFDRRVVYRWPGEGHTCEREGFLYRACPSMRHFQRYKNSCHRRDCSKHWRDWLKEESASAAERVRSAGRQRWQHVVISLGDKWELPGDTDGRKKELEKVRWILAFCGFVGGATVAHGARAHTQEDAHAAGSGGHYHILGAGVCDPERVLALHASYGIVVIAYGRDTKRPFERFRYMLSHAALPSVLNPARMEGTTPLHSITYWGILAYNKLKLEARPIEYYCPGCNEWFPARQWHDLRLLAEPPEGKEWGVLTDNARWCEPYGSWEGYQ